MLLALGKFSSRFYAFIFIFSLQILGFYRDEIRHVSSRIAGIYRDEIRYFGMEIIFGSAREHLLRTLRAQSYKW